MCADFVHVNVFGQLFQDCTAQVLGYTVSLVKWS